MGQSEAKPEQTLSPPILLHTLDLLNVFRPFSIQNRGGEKSSDIASDVLLRLE